MTDTHSAAPSQPLDDDYAANDDKAGADADGDPTDADSSRLHTPGRAEEDGSGGHLQPPVLNDQSQEGGETGGLDSGDARESDALVEQRSGAERDPAGLPTRHDEFPVEGSNENTEDAQAIVSGEVPLQEAGSSESSAGLDVVDRDEDQASSDLINDDDGEDGTGVYSDAGEAEATAAETAERPTVESGGATANAENVNVDGKSRDEDRAGEAPSESQEKATKEGLEPNKAEAPQNAPQSSSDLAEPSAVNEAGEQPAAGDGAQAVEIDEPVHPNGIEALASEDVEAIPHVTGIEATESAPVPGYEDTSYEALEHGGDARAPEALQGADAPKLISQRALEYAPSCPDISALLDPPPIEISQQIESSTGPENPNLASNFDHHEQTPHLTGSLPSADLLTSTSSTSMDALSATNPDERTQPHTLMYTRGGATSADGTDPTLDILRALEVRLDALNRENAELQSRLTLQTQQAAQIDHLTAANARLTQDYETATLEKRALFKEVQDLTTTLGYLRNKLEEAEAKLASNDALRHAEERCAKLQHENEALRAQKLQLLDKALDLKLKLKDSAYTTSTTSSSSSTSSRIAVTGGRIPLKQRYNKLPEIGGGGAGSARGSRGALNGVGSGR
ncbi:uncharacterized protein EV422DRAFT_618287 [Fimicolochytrium jonesii]|uniref:uncharacterized protein n=1 Tax=Fimicolochytrium jonesii TaxID=1396493 RepID=UPI0022FDFE16|nr:uncharacterized protein EV422DRAFT_618287 [Fimicolochytrium jonesii]KAI8823396.1 hypothetical protein EV422DRAFT_618287 [Fimicolochytrium jonesii]